MDYNLNDFTNADITVIEVERVWHNTVSSWARPSSVPRMIEGLLFFESSCIEYEFEGFGFKACGGQVVRLPSGIPYKGSKLDSQAFSFRCIDFKTAINGEFNSLPLPYSFTPSDPNNILEKFKKIEKCYLSASCCRKIELKVLLNELIETLIKDYAFNGCHVDNRSEIIKYCDFLRKNLSNSNFSLDELSENFHLSTTHLRRIFQRELGVSPQDYLQDLRLEHAQNLLITDPKLSVGQIAEACGYSSQYYFSSVFKKAFGIPPREFRSRSNI